MKVGRNDPCPCGSGRKYKQCCLPQPSAPSGPPPTGGALTAALPQAMEKARAMLGQPGAAPLTDKRGRRLKLVTDHYRGDPEKLPEGPWREDGQLLAEVAWVEGQALVTSASQSAADRLRARLERQGFVHQERRVVTPDLDEAAPALGMLDFKADFFRRWLDEALEPLGGETPREAAGSSQRGALLELLRSLEAREARLPKAERYDFGPLRRELGL